MLFKKFMSTLIKTLLIGSVAALVIGGVAYVGYNYVQSKNADEVSKSIGSNIRSGNILSSLFGSVPTRTNFAVLGVDDDGTRTDMIMVGCFNRETNILDLISVPRDTYTVMPEERRDILKEHNLWTPSGGVMKINQVHHYAGKTYGVEFIVKQLEELLDIQIEYYVKIDLEAFRYIVDAIGGVEFDVPQRMYYVDPYQDLYIDLQPGIQVLSGKDAEGLVRFRKSSDTSVSKSYARADVERAEVQQAFVKAVVMQALSKDAIMKNPTALLTAVYKYVDTNFNIGDASKYLKYLKKIKESPEGIRTGTLPGTAKTINGQSYFILDDEETKPLVKEVFLE